MVRTPEPPSRERSAPEAAPNGAFGVLDECHRQTLAALDKLEAIVARLDAGGPDAWTRALAADVVRHFSTTARQHHEDEERHVFPKLLGRSDAETEQRVLRLQQDHLWLEEDWRELEPHIDAIARSLSWYDVDFLRDGSEVFAALSRDHIELEETFLYPEARSRTGPVEAETMGREMAARRRAARRDAAKGTVPPPRR
jgi:hemerythrin-like domain-containing protein